MKCFYCNEEIGDGKARIIALDKPYLNLYFHRETCFRKVENQGTENYISENVQRIHQEFSNTLKGKKNERKRKSS
jgi:hypothetical protein